MSKFEESAKNVIDELLDHGENFKNTDSYPTRCEDSVQVLDGCSKILKGSYRTDEIFQKIKDTGITVNIIKKTFICLACLLLFFCYGCGNDNPKDVVKSFLSACQKHDFKKASKMYYNISHGTYGRDENFLKKFDGRTIQKRECFIEVLNSTYNGGTTIADGTTTPVIEIYWLSPREVLFDKDNPNKCTVFVFVQRIGVSKTTKGKSYEIDKREEVKWNLEKIIGKWAITHASTSDLITSVVVR